MNSLAHSGSIVLVVICWSFCVPGQAQNAAAAEGAAARAAAQAAPQADGSRKEKVSKSRKKKERPPADTASENEGDPSTNDLIAATLQAANAEAALPPKTHVCNAADVAARGRCPYVGQQYRATLRCAPVPTDYRAWRVASLGDDVWVTSAAGRSWHLTKTSGKSKEAEQLFRVSNFAFDVRADNPCPR